jgi:preprotein translocase subunit SecE
MKALTHYFTSSWMELKRVTWPTKNQAIQLAAITLSFVFVAAAFLGLLDFIFSQGYQYLLSLAQ